MKRLLLALVIATSTSSYAARVNSGQIKRPILDKDKIHCEIAGGPAKALINSVSIMHPAIERR